jgi:hypothetical protein
VANTTKADRFSFQNGLGSGTFAQGAPRVIEFGGRISF